MDSGTEHTHGGEDAGSDVRERRTALGGRAAVTFAGDAHDAGHTLGDEVEAGTVGIGAAAAKTGELGVNDAGVEFPHFIVAEAQALHGSLAVVFDRHIGVGEQSSSDVIAVSAFEIKGDAALVAVHHEKRGGFAADVRRYSTSSVVAARDLFDFDDVGTHVGEHQTANRPRHDVRELDDFDACEGAHLSGR